MRTLHNQTVRALTDQRFDEDSEVVVACAGVVNETYTRMLGKESEAVRRHVNKANFLARVDAHYDSFASKLKEHLRLPVAALMASQGRSCDLDGAVARHVARSKADLLSALECQPDEVAARIDATIASWKDREFEEIAA